MSAHGRMQLLSTPGGESGDLGFKLTGRAREGRGLCRVWLRRSEPWERYLDPRQKPSNWDVRVSVQRDSAFVLRDDINSRNLEELEEDFAFPQDEEAASRLQERGDDLHDRVVKWARRVLQASGMEGASASAASGESDANEAGSVSSEDPPPASSEPEEPKPAGAVGS